MFNLNHRLSIIPATLVCFVATLSLAQSSPGNFEPTAAVKRDGTRLVTPVNQLVTPTGQFIDLPGLRPQALALSPDGKLLLVAGKTHELLVADAATGAIRQHVPLPSDETREAQPNSVSTHILKPDKEGQVSFTGLVFSPDGSRIYLANVNGSIKVFTVGPDGQVSPSHSMALPAVQLEGRKEEIPAGMAFSADGKRLYVVFNMSNRLAELDPSSGSVLRQWEVGVAPYGVVLAGRKAYVSNWGGRRPGAGDLTGPAGHGTRVRVDPVRHIANEGSVSVLDLQTGKVLAEVLTGLHASGLAVSPNGRYVVVANAGSDTLSVLDTRTDCVVETIWARQNPGDLFGASPNALAFDAKGKTLFICNGTQNAVAVIGFSPPKGSRWQGLIPVGWYPGAIVHDAARKTLFVANIKGVGFGRPGRGKGGREFNSHQYYGSLSLVRVPGTGELRKLTARVLANMRAPLLAEAARPPRAGQAARPVPERVGEPSLFKHVVYLIKENRTYDQVLGDLAEGNGEPSLCVFGEHVTPNQHKMVRDFVLLDNTYCSGILSADGHQWATTSFATDYMEKSFAGFPRSYPDGMEDSDVDALAYSPAGFIWDNALARGKSVRDYGEFGITRKSWKDKSRKGSPTWLDHYHEVVQGTDNIVMYSDPGVESLRPVLATNTIGWDMDVPDVFRAAQFIKELKAFEKRGSFPEFVIICLPDDHTSGTSAGSPTPAAQVADNDLAFGQIVEALSHSPFWKDTCIFAIEDDPQAGWDHVSGYRTTAYVISPYTKRGKVVSTQYNQTSLLRTMELILGLPPMNQLDATATPMFDCFTEVPDFTPFVALTNNVPLDEMNPEPKKISDPLLRKQAYASAHLPLRKPDQCPEDQLNRIIWHAMKGSAAPYPEWAISATEDAD
jgi:YVTN family beta-propeller protein